MHAPPAGVVPLRLSVLEPDGTRITLELYSDNTVGEVKAHLALPEMCGVPASHQRLTHGGAELADAARALGACGVRDGDALLLDLDVGPRADASADLRLTVLGLEGETVTLDAHSSHTIGELKAHLALPEMCGVPARRQRLAVVGRAAYRSDYDLRDARTLEALGVRNGMTLRLAEAAEADGEAGGGGAAAPPLRVTVRAPDGARVELELDASHTVGELKARACFFIPERARARAATRPRALSRSLTPLSHTPRALRPCTRLAARIVARRRTSRSRR